MLSISNVAVRLSKCDAFARIDQGLNCPILSSFAPASIIMSMPARRLTRKLLRFTHSPLSAHGLLRPSPCRRYATRREQIPSSFSSNTIDRKPRLLNREDSVGPFQWGVDQPLFRSDEKAKKWGELSAGGKVLRTTARTTNLAVILLGAGLSALLIYSLTSELFSKNSPTVLQNQASEHLKAHPRVSKHLKFPLTFHNNPPSAVRPRHRNRYVSHKVIRDSNGREHMFLHFYVHGSNSVSHKWDEKGYFEALIDWTRDKMLLISQFTMKDSLASTKAQVMQLWERSKNTFRYLTGTPIPMKQQQPQLPAERNVRTQEKGATGSWWGITGLFDSLRRRRERLQQQKEESDTIYNEGEVQAELVRNNEGYFVFHSLIVDMPSSRNRQERIIVIGRPGMNEFEVHEMRWDS